MSHALLVTISVASGALAAALAFLLGRVGWRAPRHEGDRVGELASRLEARIDDFARELSDVMGQAEADRRWRPFLNEIAQSVDLDEVLERTLEAARRLPGGDAAVISLDTAQGAPILGTSGLPSEAIELPFLVPGVDAGQQRSIEVAFRYPETVEGGPGQDLLIRSGLGVPLTDNGGRLGFLTIFSREAEHRFGDDELQRLEELADRAAPAIENARRFREARQLADLDALTGMYNRRYFYQALEREVARARRYARSLALIVIDLDDFKAVNDRIGHLAGDEVLAVAAERILRVVRSADIACRIGGDEFAVVLPESGLNDAHQLFARIEEAILEAPIGRAERLSVSAGIAELRASDKPTEFFDAADEALYRAKQSGKARSVVASRPV